MEFLAVGDIHGSAEQLRTLLTFDGLYSSRHVVFLGDFVDIGPDSREVVELLLSFKELHHETTFLMGNHDLGLLRYLETGDFATYASTGGISTIRSYCGEVYGDVRSRLSERMPSSHRQFLEELAIYREDDEYLFSHAGYDPKSPTSRSREAMIVESHPAMFQSPTLPKLAVCGHYFQSTHRPLITPKVACVDTGCAILQGPLTGLFLPELGAIQAWPDLTVSHI